MGHADGGRARYGHRRSAESLLEGSRLTRGQFLKAAGGGAAGLLVLGPSAYAATGRAGATNGRAAVDSAAAHTARFHTFHSRPDLRPPVVGVGAGAAGGRTAEGYFFVGPGHNGRQQGGPLIVDAYGHPVWFKPLAGEWLTNFRVQRYQGQSVLTWWEGAVLPPGYGKGQGVIMDGSYREIARVRAVNGRHMDLHEFVLTSRGTALITCFPRTVRADLSAIGGGRNALVADSVIQEIDVATGRLVMEWRGLDHISISESYLPASNQYAGVWDYLHANSVDVLPDGNLLVSARHTFTIYKLNRRTGRVIWRLGGKRSNFAMAPGTRFYWQHDARHLPGGRITVFDDGAGWVQSESQSRAITLKIDPWHGKARLAHAYRHPHPVLASAMGAMQTLPDGNVIVGWGTVGMVSEFAANGRHIADLWLPSGISSYRGYRMPWDGMPTYAPALAASVNAANGTSTLYASWNGATGVSSWQVSTGPSAGALSPLKTMPARGFETAIPVGTAQGYAAVTALGRSGQRLGTSQPVKL